MWSSNFWHWIFESLPKILLLEKYNYSGIYIVPNEKFVVELLDILHINKNRVKFPAKNYIIKNIIICENHMFRANELKDNLPVVNIIRNTLIDNVGIVNGKNFSYIKRIKSRYILNEEEFLHVIHKYYFDVFIPEEHTVKQQIRYMTNVVTSIMPHGANTTLTLFQPLKSIFIECFGFAYVNYTNIHIIKLLKLLYIPIPERIESGTLNGATSLTNEKNMVVDIDLLKVILENIL
jgi:capsular polysaccharide biosynthesis protein